MKPNSLMLSALVVLALLGGSPFNGCLGYEPNGKFQFSSTDLDQLHELWQAAKRTNKELKDAVRQLTEDQWSNEGIKSLFDQAIAEAITPKRRRFLSDGSVDKGAMHPATQTGRIGGLALTEPNLEPTYPVPGGQAPAYLLPSRATNHGLIMGSPSLTCKAHRNPETNKRPGAQETIKSLAVRLVHAFQQYKTAPDRSKLYRSNLIEIVGIEAVRELDSAVK